MVDHEVAVIVGNRSVRLIRLNPALLTPKSSAYLLAPTTTFFGSKLLFIKDGLDYGPFVTCHHKEKKEKKDIYESHLRATCLLFL